jgi:putative transposase
LADWSEDNNLKIDFVRPGKQKQKSHIGRFNRTCRDELVDPYLFRTIGEVRTMTEEWRSRYNNERPHDSLNDKTLVEYLQAKSSPETLI